VYKISQCGVSIRIDILGAEILARNGIDPFNEAMIGFALIQRIQIVP
jgi:hypothetical protein